MRNLKPQALSRKPGTSDKPKRKLKHKPGAEVGLRITPRVKTGDTVGVAAGIPSRLAGLVGLPLAFHTGLLVSAGLKLQAGATVHLAVGPALGCQVAAGLPFRLGTRLTPGTVLGTVPTPVRGASISACFLKTIPLTCGAT